MENIRLAIQHGNSLFEPPIKSGIKLVWELNGSPGTLTFTTVHDPNSNFSFVEGDAVQFYYGTKPVFLGYVFSKTHDKDHNIEVTCYDQLRYLKNKYTYFFIKKTSEQIVRSLCKDFNLKVGNMEGTSYVIPSLGKENVAAIDIILSSLEETLLHTGKQFVIYDDFGKVCLRDCTNLVSENLVFEETAENFSYTTSIDDNTYNSIVLYYKEDDQVVQLYTAESQSSVAQWGLLQYFEEVKNPTIGQNKANSLLSLYNQKARTLEIKKVFGDITVRGGTFIPVSLNLDDVQVNNYMVVEKVTHVFENGHYYMDLLVNSRWNETASEEFATTPNSKLNDVISKTYGELPIKVEETTSAVEVHEVKGKELNIIVTNPYSSFAGTFNVEYTQQIGLDTYDIEFKLFPDRDLLNGLSEFKRQIISDNNSNVRDGCRLGTNVLLRIFPNDSHDYKLSFVNTETGAEIVRNADSHFLHYLPNRVYEFSMMTDVTVKLTWVR